MNIASVFPSKKKYVYRSSKTGRFVSKDYAEQNPDITQKEAIG